MEQSNQPLGLALSDQLGLIGRLRERVNFWSTDRVRWYMSSEPDGTCQEAADEIERLRRVLTLALGALSMSNPCAVEDCRAEQQDWKDCAMQEIEKALKA